MRYRPGWVQFFPTASGLELTGILFRAQALLPQIVI